MMASTQKVASNIESVSGAASDTGAAAGQVLTSAADLSTQAKHIDSEVLAFLKSVRAA